MRSLLGREVAKQDPCRRLGPRDSSPGGGSDWRRTVTDRRREGQNRQDRRYRRLPADSGRMVCRMTVDTTAIPVLGCVSMNGRRENDHQQDDGFWPLIDETLSKGK
jgi:hypothetical protein